MASKLKEQHSLSATGFLDVEELKIDIEDIGEKDLKELISKFNGCLVTLSIKKVEELE